VEALEKSFRKSDGYNKQGFVDILAGGKRWEVKNYPGKIGQTHIDRVCEGIERDLLHAIVDGGGDASNILEQMENIRILFRGSPAADQKGYLALINEVEKKGREVLGASRVKGIEPVVERFMEKIARAKDIVNKSETNPEFWKQDDFINFFGKTGYHGDFKQ